MGKVKSGNNFLGYVLSLLIDHLFAFMAAILFTTLIGLLPISFSFLKFILSVLIYAGICYGDSWRRGNSDRSRIALRQLKENKLRGVAAGFVASIPGFVLSLFALLSEINVLSVYDVFGQDIFSVLNRFWYVSFGALYDTYVNEFPVLNLVVPLFMPVFSGVGYIFGLKEISVKGYFLYKKSNVEEEAGCDEEDED